MQTITGTLPKSLAGKIKVSVFAASGAVETPLILEIEPRFTRVTPGNVFRTDTHAAHLRAQVWGEGFLPSRHTIEWAGSSITPVAATGTNTLLEFDVPSGASIGRQEVKIRWRTSPPTDAMGTPPQFLRVLGDPTIDMLSPMSVTASQSLLFSGKNYGENRHTDDVDLIFESDYPEPGGQMFTIKPLRISLGMATTDDEPATLLSYSGVSYNDPNPDTDMVFEPMPARVKVKTPEGESAFKDFTVVLDAPPPYARNLSVGASGGYLSLSTAIGYANQSPAPAGTVTQGVVCDIDGFCGDSGPPDFIPFPALYGDCHTDYPDSYTPIAGLHGEVGTKAVTPPPGIRAAAGTCNSCQGPVTCFDIAGPDSWEGIPEADISDYIYAYPPADGPGDIVISSGAPLTATNVIMQGASNADGMLKGGGLVVEGDGKDGTRRNVSLYLNIEDATGTVVTVRNARGVDLVLNISGSPCATGVLIEDSREISFSGEIRDCTNGIIVRNSEDVHVSGRFSGYSMAGAGITFDGGKNNTAFFVEMGFRTGTSGPPAPLIIPPGQGTGLRLTGGTKENGILVHTVLGSATGILFEDAMDNLVVPSFVGSITYLGDVRISADVGGSTRNAVGIHIANGAVNNKIIGPLVKENCPSVTQPIPVNFHIFGPNDTGVLIDGGNGNEVCGHFFGVPSFNYILPPEGVGNEVGVKIMGPGAMNTLIHGNEFGDNHMYGLEADNATGQGIAVEKNIFGKELPDLARPFPETMPNPPNGICGLHVTNATQDTLIRNNNFKGEKKAICIDNSRQISFKSNLVQKSEIEGVRMENSHSVSFDSDRVCGGQIALNGSCGNQYITPLGMHIIASSDFRLRKVRVERINGDGIEIEQPPAQSFGLSRVEGELPTGTVAGPPDRDEFFDPVRFPPQNRISDTKSTIFRGNAGRGIFVRDGAKNIALAGVLVYSNQSHGIHLVNPGAGIRIEESRIGLDENGAAAVNQGDGVRLEFNGVS
ncbi:MAG: right-handed parallel beta-helix repeat-containing protein, partial [bacterium]